MSSRLLAHFALPRVVMRLFAIEISVFSRAIYARELYRVIEAQEIRNCEDDARNETALRQMAHGSDES